VAGVELGTAFISVSLGTGNLAGQIKKAFAGAGDVGASAGKEAGGGFASSFGGLVKGAIVAATAGVFGSYIAEAAQASDATDKFISTMNFAGLDTGAIDKAKNAAKDYADQTVYDLPTIQKTIAQLASNGVKDYTGLTKAAGNLNAVAGGNAETFKSVSMVLSQTAGAGKLTAENWNQLADAIPGASGPIQKALEKNKAFTGNFRDAMSEGQITAEEFNTALLELGTDPVAVEAAASTKTFEGAIGSLNAAINSQLMSALDLIKPAFTGVVSSIAEGVGKIGPLISGVSAILFKGDFTGEFAKAFNIEEDSKIVDFLFNLREAFIPVGNVIKAMGPVIGTIFQNLGPQVLGLASALSPLGLAFMAIEPILPTLAVLLGAVAVALGTQLGAILPTITGLVSTLANILSANLVAIMPILVQVVGAVIQAIGQIAPVISMVVAALAPLIISLVSQLVPVFTNLFTTVLPPLIEMFLSLVSAVLPFVTAILGVLIPAVQNLIPVVVNGFNIIADIIKAAMQIVQGIIEVVTGVITGNWSRVWQGIGNILSGVWNTIGAIVRGAISFLAGAISAGLNNIWGIWSGIWNMVSGFLGSAWSGIVNGVSSGVGNVMGVIGSLPGRIMGALAGAGGWLVGIGVNVIQGLINGISSMMGAIGRAILNIVPEAIRGPFQAALGIHSPSRVFMGYGVNIGEGLIIGTDKMKGKIQDTMENLVSLPALPTNQFAGDAGLAATPVGFMANQFYITPADPEGAAAAVARRLNNQVM
jgi:tape measure domain-containing protein